MAQNVLIQHSNGSGISAGWKQQWNIMAYLLDENTNMAWQELDGCQMVEWWVQSWESANSWMVREGCLSTILLFPKVKPQAHSSLQADLDVHHHPPCGLVPKQSGHHHSHPYDLIGIDCLLGWDVSDDWCWAALHRLYLPQHLGDFLWTLVVGKGVGSQMEAGVV